MFLFQLKYGKVYRNEVEDRFRMKIFMDNKYNIIKHNQESAFHGFELGKSFK